MSNLTTPKAVLVGFLLLALAIASLPYSARIITPAKAQSLPAVVEMFSQTGKRLDMVVDKLYEISIDVSAIKSNTDNPYYRCSR